MTASSTAAAEAATSGRFSHRENTNRAPVLTPTPTQPTHANFSIRTTLARLAGVIKTLGCTNISLGMVVITRAVYPCRLIRSTASRVLKADRSLIQISTGFKNLGHQ